MPKYEIKLTVEHPIPSWKGPEENGIPDILWYTEEPPPISGMGDNRPPYHCADTVGKDGGIIDMEKILGTVFDDQE